MSNEETFKRNFATFTENQFDGWNEWDNMVVIGGSVVGSLMPIPSEYAGKERDFFHEVTYRKLKHRSYFLL